MPSRKVGVHRANPRTSGPASATQAVTSSSASRLVKKDMSSSAVCSAGGICGTAATRAAVYSDASAGPSSAEARRTDTSGRTGSVLVTNHLQRVGEVVGVRRLVLDVLPRAGMLEAEPGG